MEEVIKSIVNLYKSPNGSGGGYAHIVFDDHNIQDDHIKWCIAEAEKGEYEWIGEETRLASIAALEYILTIPEDQRQEIIDMADLKIY